MRRLWILLLAVVIVATAACGGDEDHSGNGSGDGGSADSVTLTVFAAASLKSTFEELGKQFESEHEGVTLQFSFAGSSDLVAQIQGGAAADVFASADENNMKKLTDDGLNGSEPKIFATNTLTIAVPPDNPAGVASLQDLAKDGLNLVICAPQVPCGSATQKVAESAGLDLKPVSEEQSVTDVLTKVTSGEADAGLVYVTDAKSAGDKVEAIDFPESDAVVNRYPIAEVKDSQHADLAQEFIDLVTGEEGQQVLSEAGFGAP
ncbi:molybdate ABC transporter substrate-binding protein [Blastococcus sp. Marseille-P5729]|uniref:molybdate ABC transporter substrate-binding protein n=1 Tax=Blastococcus sp. Marseille-P5729 TaxID=2086582 RepID=UPI000D10D0AA|nr:molybdate ABC transporter substrate-binding protein [Blastococcus sp. Marseille-P5729]